MVINIQYNNKIDEFTDDLSLEERLRTYIQKHFPLAYIVADEVPIYLVGGAIRDLIYAQTPKDLDFLVLGKENLDLILSMFRTFNIEYGFNRFGGFKFNYQGTIIDLWLTDDFYSAIQYNVDGLFFDLKNDSLLSLTFDDFCQNGLRLLGKEDNIEFSREQKLKKFEQKYLMNKK